VILELNKYPCCGAWLSAGTILPLLLLLPLINRKNYPVSWGVL